MNTVTIDYGNVTGPIKRMNAVNNGPVYELHRENPLTSRNNMESYKALNIPYARLHDTPFFADYGGDHVVDVHLIFRDFNADPYDPKSYDFACTDQLLKVILTAGTKPFYRLGCSIEGHLCKKYAIYPPEDFKKWSVICEHIIAHYNEGWADGFNMDIEYWEIWNEPNSIDMWLGTPDEFNDLYIIASKHLKKRFPYIKIGGPAFCNLDEVSTNIWARPFLQRVKEENAPLDFFSWHGYTLEMNYLKTKLIESQGLLNEYGFTHTENILNEWNYAKDFSVAEFKELLSVKGAAFTSAYMTICQDGPIDMLMYYDARPTVMNNLFDQDFFEPRKGYYVHKVWGDMLSTGAVQCVAENDIADIYVTAAKNGSEEFAIITYYTNEKSMPSKDFDIIFKNGKYNEKSVYLLDSGKNAEKIATVDAAEIKLTIEPNTVIIIK